MTLMMVGWARVLRVDKVALCWFEPFADGQAHSDSDHRRQLFFVILAGFIVPQQLDVDTGSRIKGNNGYQFNRLMLLHDKDWKLALNISRD